jgi:single-strand DNA-binding protein
MNIMSSANANNNLNLIGHLVADPELRMTNGGTPVCQIRIAVDAAGESSAAGFFDVTEYGERGAASARVLSQGWKVHVHGRLVFSEWTDKESGKSRSKVSVVGDVTFLRPKMTDEEKAARGLTADGPTDLPPAPADENAKVLAGVSAGAPADDDIPF